MESQSDVDEQRSKMVIHVTTIYCDILWSRDIQRRQRGVCYNSDTGCLLCMP